MSVDVDGILFASWEGTNGAAENRPFRSRFLNRAILILHITLLHNDDNNINRNYAMTPINDLSKMHVSPQTVCQLPALSFARHK